MASKPYPDTRRGVWLCKYRPDPSGPWVRVTLGKDPRLRGARPPRTPPQAVQDRAREFAEIEYNARHGLRAAPARAKPLDGYLDAYAEAFAATHKAGSTRQLRRHAKQFGEFCAARGVATVQGVTRAVCRDYLEARAQVVAHDTLKTEMRYLAPIWSRAVEDGLMATNPWARQKVPGKSTRSAPVFWTSAEVARIAAACAKAWQSDLVLVLANTGLRISTALALRWAWVDWAAGTVTIPAEAAARHDGVKTSYRFGMNRVARDVLQRRQAVSRSDLVFPNPYRGGREVPYDSAREAIARAIKKAGVKPGTPHDLRHTYARSLVESGVPLPDVMRLLGHSNISTTMTYASTDDEAAAKRVKDFGIGEATEDHDPSPPRP